ncbi:putative late blight resistance protein-like R1C-3 [Vitis vinifera]|uniref:Putative late blight resistance protein-like R1C-3 n=1 Tax=Vitis vinifera TaxID=29760 RepID=A0A438JM43_VITVI|nr:putative late blight resistance protein-like R1C-3 [Vitis vinifera]
MKWRVRSSFSGRWKQHLGWPQGLEKLGKEIVAKCKGLPLATVMFGRPSINEREDPILMAKENSVVKSSELIRLWIAEGFVQTRGAETLEDLAEDYLYELIQRNMIQVDKRDRLDGRVKSCRMHDFL